MKKYSLALLFTAAAGISLFLLCDNTHQADAAANGPLRVLSSNSRYLADSNGKAVFLTGSYQGSEFQDNAWNDTLDWNWYLNFLGDNDMNFIRLWVTWFTEDPGQTGSPTWPMPFARSGTCCANDGQNKFDLNQLDQAFFDRLRTRITQARDRNIYVAIILFDKWSFNTEYGDRWATNPFHADNNVNGINGDINGDEDGQDALSLDNSAAVAAYERYVAKVIDTVNDLDNVFYEIANEPAYLSRSFSNHMTTFIKNRESSKPKQHVVWMSSYADGEGNDTLASSPADVIGPGPRMDDPPVPDTSKVVLLDTDHLEPFTTNSSYPWRAFTRGYAGLAHMDGLNGWPPGSDYGPIRRVLGNTAKLAARANLAAMTPRGDLSSTGYVLANPGSEYIVYQPDGGGFNVDLGSGSYQAEWIGADSTQSASGGSVSGGGSRDFNPPFGGASVLYLRGAGAGATPTPTPTPTTGQTPTPTPTPTPSTPATGTCHKYTFGTTIPDGFGAPWDVLSAAKTLLMSATCSGSSVSMTFAETQNPTSPYRYTYKNGHFAQPGAASWTPISLTGSGIVSDNWYPAKATASFSIPDISKPTYALGYICSWTGNIWKCGCRDDACTQSYWQIQQLMPGATATPTPTPTPTSSGSGGAKALSFLNKSQRVVFPTKVFGPDASTSLTTEAWIYLRETNDGAILSQDDGGLPYVTWGIFFTESGGSNRLNTIYSMFLKGSIDELRIYYKALSAGEISAHYNNGRGTVGQPETGLVGCGCRIRGGHATFSSAIKGH